MNSESKQVYNIMTPVSAGELIDKITILEIKIAHMTGIKISQQQ